MSNALSSSENRMMCIASIPSHPAQERAGILRIVADRVRSAIQRRPPDGLKHLTIPYFQERLLAKRPDRLGLPTAVIEVSVGLDEKRIPRLAAPESIQWDFSIVKHMGLFAGVKILFPAEKQINA